MRDRSRRRLVAGGRHRVRPSCEVFEDRLLLTAYTVTNTLDDGPGSLRDAINNVDSDSTPDTINFDITGDTVTGAPTAPQSIELQSPLPPIFNQVTIDGTTQPGYSSTNKVPQVVIDGQAAIDQSGDGFTIFADNTIIQGLAIINSGAAGIDIEANNVGIYSNYIGIDPINSAVAPNRIDGISVSGASNNIIGAPGEGNLIAGNDLDGISIASGSNQNLIQGNAIGTTLQSSNGGTGISVSPQEIANTGDGIMIGSSTQNTIGGTASGAGNIISGNDGRGLNIQGSPGTLVQGNTIGLESLGTVALGNGSDGILVADTVGVTIGGTTSGAGNLIASNNGNGILSNTASDLLIQGNKIGTDTTGEVDRGNSDNGILLDQSPDNTIGGSVAGAGNLVSGNSADGISLETTTTTKNLIQGNTIGIDLAGLKAIANALDGIELVNSPKNTIGGTTVGAGNIASGNAGGGIVINGVSGSDNLIQGNVVGTNAADSNNTIFGNAFDGIDINESPANTVGGTVNGAGNILVLNQGNGVHIQGATATANLIVGNHIGTDLNADPFLGNFHTGVNIESSPGNTIGGTTNGATNFIVSSQVDAIDIQSTDADAQGKPIPADHNLVEGNDIGISIDQSGTEVPLQNVNNGLYIVASYNTIGGTVAGSGNVISENNSIGITVGSLISPAGLITATGNVIQGNIIGLDNTGTEPAGNGRDGIQLIGAFDTTIGGTVASAANVISGNTIGMEIFSPNSSANAPLGDVIEGNIIGLGIDGQTLAANNASSLQTTKIEIPANTSNTSVFVREVNVGPFVSTQGASLNNTSEGIIIESGAEGVTIGGSTTNTGNVISGNGGSGLEFESGAFNNAVEANLIGLAQDGVTIRANNQSGIFVSNGSTGITIGGTTPGSGNTISGNTIGITLTNSGTSNNLVEGNTIGLARDGSTEDGNLSFGLLLFDGTTGDTIGGTTSGARNVISANGEGIGITGTGSDSNLVEGNYIGLDATGTQPRGNLELGLTLSTASNNTIGGTVAGSGNVISGNSGVGVQIFGPDSANNLVAGNLIGLNASGTSTTASNGATLGNSGYGIEVENAPSNTIGGSTPGSGNVISGNRQGGIDLNGSTAAFNVIEANLIGLDASGSFAMGNLADGIQVDGAPANVIGGTSAGTRNVISANVGSGVEFDGSGAFFDEVLGNYIGTNITGSAALGNGLSGVFVNGAPGVTIGGTIAGLGNLISGNTANGIQITGEGSAGTIVLGNSIGVDATGSFAIGNGNDGVLFDGTSSVTVGGTVPGSGNLISGNTANGVEFGGSGSSSDVLQGNLIGTNSTGSTALPNATGVFVTDSIDNLIGGTAPYSGNLISGNTGPGVHIFGLGSLNNTVEGNRIGTDLVGQAPLANQAGVFIDEAPGNVIAGNLLSANSAAGVVIEGTTASGNLIQGNLIGLNVTGSRAIGSTIPQQSGVLLDDAPGNVIGGSTPATRNVISGNTAGVVIAGFDSQGNLVLGNLIGLDATGSSAVANGTGVYINGSSSNTIGGAIPGSTNVISGNTGIGVYLYGTQSTDNLIAANEIGTNAAGTAAIPNSSGVYADLASNNTVGGSTSALGNLISGNTVAGVYFFDSASDNVVESNRIGISSTGKKLGNLQYGVLLYNAANNSVPTTGTAANTIANSGIGNYREFTGAIPTTSTTTSTSSTVSTKSKSKGKTVSIKSVHPTGPKVTRPGSAGGSSSTHRTGS